MYQYGFGQTFVLVKDVYQFASDGNPRDIVTLNGNQIFGAITFATGNELFISDGTTAGTVLLKDINPNLDIPSPPGTGGGIGSAPRGMTVYSNLVWFSASDGTNGTELWSTDGTTAGTNLFLDISPGSSNPEDFEVFGGLLYFTANDAVVGEELWVTDGTVAGTNLFNDFRVGGNFSPDHKTVVGSTLFFTANDGVNGVELWKTDGTVAGTSMVRNINTTGSSSPDDLIEMNGILYFSADDGVNGRELWRSDGTMAGTTMVMDINLAGSGMLNIGDERTIGVYNSNLYFGASSTGAADMELWQSDGTGAGTSLFLVINPGGSALPAGFTHVGTGLAFAATNSTTGRELYTTQGTIATTMLTSDLNPGSNSSLPQQIHYDVAGNNVYLRAEDSNLTGAEYWKYGPIILPIELVSFTAIKLDETALLEWQTASETNNEKFVIERSINGVDFERIGEVMGAGNSTHINNYEFIDDAPENGINYYRLKQVDFDSTFEYSEIRSLNFEQGLDIKVYPNPVSNHLTIESGFGKGQAVVQIHDMQGKRVSMQYLMMKPVIELPMHELSKGTYILSIQIREKIFTETLVKQ